MQNSKNKQLALRKTVLALAIGALAGNAYAATNTASGDKKAEDTIVVQESAASDFKAGGDTLVPAYLDGQIANGGRLGMLGQQKAMDVPFNIIGFTSKLVEDQQARTIADVVRNDAGVQPIHGYGLAGEAFRIRGLKMNGEEMLMGGLPGIVSRQIVDTQMIERIEVFKGANTLVNGSSSTGVGGVINLEPKHAEDTPLARVGMDYASDSQIGTSVDAGRRFGDNNQFGARVNLLHREGEGRINDDRRRTTLASLGLDYRGENLRTSLDVGYQEKKSHGDSLGLNISGVSDIPALPSNSRNYSQKWNRTDIKSEFGMARAEYDLNSDWTAYAAMGGQHANEILISASNVLTDNAGNAVVRRMGTHNVFDTFSGMAGVRGQFDTGFVSHKVNVGYSAATKNTKTAWNYHDKEPGVNIYNPQFIDEPATTPGAGNFSDPLTTERARSQGVLLSDTLGVLDDRLLFTVGTRYQEVVARTYDYNSGAMNSTTAQNSNRWLPGYGVVYKPWEEVSFYANHTEALQPQSTSIAGFPQFGTRANIAHSKQNEAGVKVDFGNIGGSMALFEIKKPYAYGDLTLGGEQRNRGVELNVFGEPVLGLRLNGSTTWIDAELTKAEDAANKGNTAIGVPSFVAVLGAEYDIKPISGLTATARLNHTGSQYANLANTKKLDNYTTLDLGVRYRMQLNQEKNQMVWRVGVNNVTNENYWSGVDDSGTYLYQGEPRTLKVSMSYDF